ncbi:DUF1217 domain-containing protein [Oricola cellulosilytica]|uniref:DUF1217 domain-containing protein n=2 Tax=Oricola cellulosilytica TaxID=1429082 RepID=A0A4R0PFU9_9HYPH|nr:DUF1217 domain-containing protein [Oricola cellulosilytica]
MISTLASYKLATSDLSRTIQRVSDQPTVAREVAYYEENISKVKTIEEFIDDTRLFNFAMQAHGLGEMSYAKAFMKKVLVEGRDARDSFANSLTDKRYLEFAETFDFYRYGETATTFTKARQGTVEKYLRQTLEEQAGDENEGVRLALYFQRKAPTITSYYGILADPALGQVVRTAIGLPDSVGSIDIDKQVEMMKDRIDLEEFSDPAALEKFLERFTTLWEVNNGSATAQSSGIGLLYNQGATFGISQDLMLQIQQLKR